MRWCVYAACRAYLFAFRGGEGISPMVRDLETRLRRAPDQSPRLAVLLPKPLSYLDVGARGGLSDLLARYRKHLTCFLVEPDSAEAAALAARGFRVIDKLLADRSGRSTLNLTRKPGLSSTLEPAGEMLDYYRGDSDRFEVVRRVELDTTTIEAVARESAARFDLLKVDTQGSELSVLKGLGEQRPLFIISEVSFAELYAGQATIFEIGAHLRGLGYVPFDLTYTPTEVPGGFRRYQARCAIGSGLPLHADACFMPNWASPKGRAILEGRESAWAALMLIFGMEDILRYVLSKARLQNGDAILQALRTPPAASHGGLSRPVRY